MLAFHGTSIQSAISIFKNGYCAPFHNWKVSKNKCYVMPFAKHISSAFLNKKAMAQGFSAALRNKKYCKPAVMLLDITDKSVLPDDTRTFDAELNPLTVEDPITPNDVLAIYSLELNCAFLRPFFTFRMKDNFLINPSYLSKTDKILLNSLENITFKPDSFVTNVKTLIDKKSHEFIAPKTFII